MPITAERYLTVPEVAAELRVSRRSIYRAIERRELPAVRVGSSIRIRADALEALLQPVRIRPEETTP